MAVKTILIAAFAALVAAVPQHAEHLGKAQVARSSNIFARSELLGRTVSYDGSCGSWSGMTCPDNGCCSSQGWCGSSSIHCGAGCQAGFGQCGSGSESTPAVQPATVQAPTVAEAQPAAVVAPVIDTPAAAPVVAPVVAPAASPVVAPVVAPAPAPVTTTTSTPTPTPTPTPAAAPVTVPAEQVKGNGAASPKQTVSGTDSSTSTSSTNSGLGDTYKLYTGDGSMAAGWPAQSSWMDFDSAFEANRGLMKQSCAQFGAANNNDDEINNLKSALQSVGSSSGVDARYLLAIVMQESGGCVRAPTTNYGVRNPGLFQSHDGSGTCNDSGNAQNPCPMSSITQMITDGAAGTAAGDGLKQTLLQAGTSDASKYYRAARIYNSGSIAASGQLQDGIATHCYSSDVANRLTGWVHAAHGCSQ